MATYYEQITGAIRSPMEYQQERMKRQADIQRMQDEQELMKQRKNILQQFFQPAVAERQELAPVGVNPLAALMQPEQPANMVESRFAGVGRPASAGSIIPQHTSETIPGKKEVYDLRGAMGALFGVGDIEGGKQMADLEKMSQRDRDQWSGDVTYIDDPENPGTTIAVQPSTRGEGAPFRTIGVARMTPAQQAGIEAKKKDTELKADGLDLNRQEFLWNLRKFYEAPELEARKDAIAAAGTQGRSADATLAILDQVEPYLDKASSSDLERLARKGGSFLGFDSAAASADRVIEQAAASLTLSAPKLGGAASDRDVALYARAMGALSSGTIQQKREAMQFIRQKLQQYGASDAAAPSRPAPAAPKPAAKLPSMPPAKAHSGRTVRDTDTGITYKSDGTKWVRVK